MDQFFWLVFVAFVIYFCYSVFTKHGRGRMFGGKIIATLEPHIERKDGLQTTKIKVHLVELGGNPSKRDVGLEVSTSAYLSWSMLPIRLSATEAKELAGLLNRALAGVA